MSTDDNYGPHTYYEILVEPKNLERFTVSHSPWHETPEERERRWAYREFLDAVRQHLYDAIDNSLTSKQRAVALLYLARLPQEEIAKALHINQSTVSRHLHGTNRHGKKVGGIVGKLRRILDKNPEVQRALKRLEDRRNMIFNGTLS